MLGARAARSTSSPKVPFAAGTKPLFTFSLSPSTPLPTTTTSNAASDTSGGGVIVIEANAAAMLAPSYDTPPKEMLVAERRKRTGPIILSKNTSIDIHGEIPRAASIQHAGLSALFAFLQSMDISTTSSFVLARSLKSLAESLENTVGRRPLSLFQEWSPPPYGLAKQVKIDPSRVRAQCRVDTTTLFSNSSSSSPLISSLFARGNEPTNVLLPLTTKPTTTFMKSGGNCSCENEEDDDNDDDVHIEGKKRWVGRGTGSAEDMKKCWVPSTAAKQHIWTGYFDMGSKEHSASTSIKTDTSSSSSLSFFSPSPSLPSVMLASVVITFKTAKSVPETVDVYAINAEGGLLLCNPSTSTQCATSATAGSSSDGNSSSSNNNTNGEITGTIPEIFQVPIEIPVKCVGVCIVFTGTLKNGGENLAVKRIVPYVIEAEDEEVFFGNKEEEEVYNNMIRSSGKMGGKLTNNDYERNSHSSSKRILLQLGKLASSCVRLASQRLSASTSSFSASTSVAAAQPKQLQQQNQHQQQQQDHVSLYDAAMRILTCLTLASGALPLLCELCSLLFTLESSTTTATTTTSITTNAIVDAQKQSQFPTQASASSAKLLLRAIAHISRLDSDRLVTLHRKHMLLPMRDTSKFLDDPENLVAHHLSGRNKPTPMTGVRFTHDRKSTFAASSLQYIENGRVLKCVAGSSQPSAYLNVSFTKGKASWSFKIEEDSYPSPIFIGCCTKPLKSQAYDSSSMTTIRCYNCRVYHKGSTMSALEIGSSIDVGQVVTFELDFDEADGVLYVTTPSITHKVMATGLKGLELWPICLFTDSGRSVSVGKVCSTLPHPLLNDGSIPSSATTDASGSNTGKKKGGSGGLHLSSNGMSIPLSVTAGDAVVTGKTSSSSSATATAQYEPRIPSFPLSRGIASEQPGTHIYGSKLLKLECADHIYFHATKNPASFASSTFALPSTDGSGNVTSSNGEEEGDEEKKKNASSFALNLWPRGRATRVVSKRTRRVIPGVTAVATTAAQADDDNDDEADDDEIEEETNGSAQNTSSASSSSSSASSSTTTTTRTLSVGASDSKVVEDESHLSESKTEGPALLHFAPSSVVVGLPSTRSESINHHDDLAVRFQQQHQEQLQRQEIAQKNPRVSAAINFAKQHLGNASVAIWYLRGEFDTFTGGVAVHSPTLTPAQRMGTSGVSPVIFEVYGDNGHCLWRSEPAVHVTQVPPSLFDIPVIGQQTLTLVTRVTVEGANKFAPAMWVKPQLREASEWMCNGWRNDCRALACTLCGAAHPSATATATAAATAPTTPIATTSAVADSSLAAASSALVPSIRATEYATSGIPNAMTPLTAALSILSLAGHAAERNAKSYRTPVPPINGETVLDLESPFIVDFSVSGITALRKMLQCLIVDGNDGIFNDSNNDDNDDNDGSGSRGDASTKYEIVAEEEEEEEEEEVKVSSGKTVIRVKKPTPTPAPAPAHIRSKTSNITPVLIPRPLRELQLIVTQCILLYVATLRRAAIAGLCGADAVSSFSEFKQEYSAIRLMQKTVNTLKAAVSRIIATASSATSQLVNDCSEQEKKEIKTVLDRVFALFKTATDDVLFGIATPLVKRQELFSLPPASSFAASPSAFTLQKSTTVIEFELEWPFEDTNPALHSAGEILPLETLLLMIQLHARNKQWRTSLLGTWPSRIHLIVEVPGSSSSSSIAVPQEEKRTNAVQFLEHDVAKIASSLGISGYKFPYGLRCGAVMWPIVLDGRNSGDDEEEDEEVMSSFWKAQRINDITMIPSIGVIRLYSKALATSTKSTKNGTKTIATAAVRVHDDDDDENDGASSRLAISSNSLRITAATNNTSQKNNDDEKKEDTDDDDDDSGVGKMFERVVASIEEYLPQEMDDDDDIE